MKKIIFILSLFVCVLLGSTAYAAQLACTFDLDAGAVDITGTAGAGGTYTLLILNPGYTLDTVQDGSHMGVQFQYEGKTDESGTFAIRVPLNTELIGQQGEMAVYLSYPGLSTPVCSEFYYTDADGMKAAAEAVLGIADMTETEDIIAVLDQNSGIFAYNTEVYKALDKTELAEHMRQYVQHASLTPEDYEELQKELKMQSLLCGYNQGLEKLLIQDGNMIYAEELGLTGLDKEKNITAYSLYSGEINAEGIQNVHKALFGNEYTSLEAFYLDFASAAVVEGVRNYAKSGVGHISGILEKNAAYVQLDLSSYVSSHNKDSQIKNANCDSIAALQEIINKPLSNGTTGSSGSGSSGGGGSAYFPSQPEEPGREEIVSEIEQDKYILTDMQEHSWAAQAVRELMEQGIIAVPPDGRYRPADYITREELVKLAVEAFGIEPAAEQSGFTDVTAEDWSAEYIYAAQAAGIVDGVGDGRFDKKAYVTREDMAAILSRCLDYKGIQLPVVQEELRFTDEGEISDYAREAVMLLAGAGALNGMGDGTFAPKDPCTRAQCAVVLHKLING